MKNKLTIVQRNQYSDFEQIGVYPFGLKDGNKPHIWVNKYAPNQGKVSGLSWNQGFLLNAEDSERFLEGLKIAIEKAKEPLRVTVCEGIVIDKCENRFCVAVIKHGGKHVPARNSWSTEIRQEDAIWCSPGLDGKGKLDIGSRVEFNFCRS